jgi:hypothetical protein
MSDTVYCYHCRRHHPADEVTRVESRGVKRWRCRQSISLSQRSIDQRDAFGKAVSLLNQASCAKPAGNPLPRPVLELFGSSRGGFEAAT